MENSEISSLFDEQMKRLYLVTGTRTQMELADVLGIRQSSVSDAKKRQNVPAEWLITILRTKGVHPDWILTGGGTCSAYPSAPSTADSQARAYPAKDEALKRLSSRELTDELLRRIASRPGPATG